MLRPTLSLIQLPIQPNRTQLDQRGAYNARDASKQDKSTTKAIVRLLIRGKEIRTEPMTNLTDTIRDRNKCRLLTPWRRDKRSLPAELQV